MLIQSAIHDLKIDVLTNYFRHITKSNYHIVVDLTRCRIIDKNNMKVDVQEVDSTPLIFLNMIVKNESKIIERCMDNVSWIDGLVISDTGSTDDTREIIEAWRVRNKKMGAVVQNEWKNFGHNRTVAMEEGRKWCLENDLDLANVYFLLIDADMVLPGAENLKKVVGEADLWDIRQQNPSMIYHNLRVARASLDIVCMCPTHEYYDIRTPNATRKTFDDVIINDVGDGGAKSDKVERDIRLLKEALTTDPKNCRYWFYLANTYRDSRDYGNAILSYQQRIDVGGWYEETYCAMLYKGDCHLHMKQDKEAICVWLDAVQIDSSRAEALLRLATYYREKSKHHTAMLFVERGLKIQQPKRLLFIEKTVYEYKMLYELSICAYYTGDRDRGKLACKMLLDMENVPGFIRTSVEKNLTFYNK